MSRNGKVLGRAVAGVAVGMLGCGSVWAMSCQDAFGPLTFSMVTAGPPIAVAIPGTTHMASAPECNPAVISFLLTNGGRAQMGIINQVVSSRSGAQMGPQQIAQGPGSGLASGDAWPRWNTWITGANNDLAYDGSQGSGSFRFDGDKQGVTLGGDYRLTAAATLGLSLSYDDGSATPKQGNGLRLDNRGYNVAPYFAYQLTPQISVDATVGWGQGTMSRSGGGLASYSVDTQRQFAGVNLNAGYWFGNWQMTSKASLLYSAQKNDADGAQLDEALKYLAQARVGTQLGYWVGNGWMPYLSATYVNDFARNSTGGYSFDRDGFLLGLGTHYFSRGGVTAGASFVSEVGRRNTTNNVFTANLSVRF